MIEAPSSNTTLRLGITATGCRRKVTATNTIYFDKTDASDIVLPVLDPRSPRP